MTSLDVISKFSITLKKPFVGHYSPYISSCYQHPLTTADNPAETILTKVGCLVSSWSSVWVTGQAGTGSLAQLGSNTSDAGLGQTIGTAQVQAWREGKSEKKVQRS